MYRPFKAHQTLTTQQPISSLIALGANYNLHPKKTDDQAGLFVNLIAETLGLLANLIAETLGGEKSVGEEALGVAI